MSSRSRKIKPWLHITNEWVVEHIMKFHVNRRTDQNLGQVSAVV